MQGVTINQIYYLPSQLPLLDPAFTPYDNTANENREFAEYHIFEKEYNAGKIANDALTGYVSWKFGDKTRLQGSQFLKFIAANPGYDVYFINPFPMQMKFFKNLWLQGEFYHPGILELSQRIFERAGYAIRSCGRGADKTDCALLQLLGRQQDLLGQVYGVHRADHRGFAQRSRRC
jgi:hypothetical protein